MIRRRIATLLLPVASTAIGLAVVEGALRLAGAATTASFYLSPPHAKLHDVQTEWDLVYETNRLGLRDEEIPRTKPAGETRVALVGDSFTFGQGCPRGQIAPDLLQAHLRAGGIRAEVVNASNYGLGPAAYLAIVRDVVLPMQPDLIVVNVYGNDASDVVRRPLWRRCAVALAERSRVVTVVRKAARLWKLRHEADVSRALSEHASLPGDADGSRSRALERFRQRYGTRPNNLITALALDPGEIERSIATDPQGIGWQEFRDNMSDIVRACRRSGVPLVIGYVPDAAQIDAAHASLLRDFGVRVPDDSLTTPTRFEALVAAFAAEQSIPFFDPTARFRAQAGPLYFETDLHWNASGHAVYADALEEFLATRGLLRGATPR